MSDFEKTYKGVRIAMDNEGKFQAAIDGKIVTRASLASIEKLITDSQSRTQAQAPVKLMRARFHDHIPEETTVVGVERKGGRFASYQLKLLRSPEEMKGGGLTVGVYSTTYSSEVGAVYEYDPQTVEEMKKLKTELADYKDDWNKRYQALRNRLVRLDIEQIEAKLLEARQNASTQPEE